MLAIFQQRCQDLLRSKYEICLLAQISEALGDPGYDVLLGGSVPLECFEKLGPRELDLEDSMLCTHDLLPRPGVLVCSLIRREAPLRGVVPHSLAFFGREEMRMCTSRAEVSLAFFGRDEACYLPARGDMPESMAQAARLRRRPARPPCCARRRERRRCAQARPHHPAQSTRSPRASCPALHVPDRAPPFADPTPRVFSQGNCGARTC